MWWVWCECGVDVVGVMWRFRFVIYVIGMVRIVYSVVLT